METQTIDSPPEAAPFQTAVEASADADASRVDVVREYEEMHPVSLTDTELLDRGASLAQQHAEIAHVESEIAREKAEHRARMEELGEERDDKLGRASAVARVIRDRAEERLVKCREERVFATGVVRVVRLDTGAVVTERAMQKDERQASLFPDGEPEPAEVHSGALVDDPDDEDGGDPDVPPCGSASIGGTVTAIGSEVEPAIAFFVDVDGVETAVELGELAHVPAMLAVGNHVEIAGDYREGGSAVKTLSGEARELCPTFMAVAVVAVGDAPLSRDESGEDERASATIDNPEAVLGAETEVAVEKPKKKRGRRG